MDQNNNINELRAFDERYRQERAALMQNMHQKRIAEIQQGMKRHMSPQMQAQTEDPNVVPPHVQQLALLGEVKALVSEVKEMVSGITAVKGLEASPEDQNKEDIKPPKGKKDEEPKK